MSMAQEHARQRKLDRVFSKPVCWLRKTIDGEFFAFDALSFKRLRGPGVYLVFGIRDVVLYVGMAKNILSRMCSPDHEGLTKAFSEPITNIFIVPAKSEAHARQLEADYIRLHQPKYNQRGKFSEFERMQMFIQDFKQVFEQRLG